MKYKVGNKVKVRNLKGGYRAPEEIFTYDTKGSNLYFLSLYVQHNIVGKINEIIDKVNGEDHEN